jgi:hypothetical protein
MYRIIIAPLELRSDIIPNYNSSQNSHGDIGNINPRFWSKPMCIDRVQVLWDNRKPSTSVIHQKNRFNVRNWANKLNLPNTDKHGREKVVCASMNRVRIQEVAGTIQMPRYWIYDGSIIQALAQSLSYKRLISYKHLSDNDHSESKPIATVRASCFAVGAIWNVFTIFYQR